MESSTKLTGKLPYYRLKTDRKWTLMFLRLGLTGGPASYFWEMINNLGINFMDCDVMLDDKLNPLLVIVAYVRQIGVDETHELASRLDCPIDEPARQ